MAHSRLTMDICQEGERATAQSHDTAHATLEVVWISRLISLKRLGMGWVILTVMLDWLREAASGWCSAAELQPKSTAIPTRTR